MTTGIHHVAGITRDVQANVDFYAGFLGLRLVKRTAGFDESGQLRLFYGDRLGSPGSLVSFLVWQDGASGRTGLGQVSELAFAVPPAAIGNWLTRAMTAGIPTEGPRREFGETVLRLKDPDGIIIKLVGLDLPATASLPGADAPTRIRAATLLTADPEAATAMLERFGYRKGPVEGAITRMLSLRDAVDVRAVAGYTPGITGAGTFDRIALRAPDDAALDAAARSLSAEAAELQDRTYYRGLSLRDAGGLLYEYATDGPGFTLDETAESLGQRLITPLTRPDEIAALTVTLPQFALGDAPRQPRRQLLFTHRLFAPDAASGRVIVTLHGQDGTETSLLPLAHEVDPTARLIGIRGRASDSGMLRWFRAFDLDHFDQADIRAEAQAFAVFLADLGRLHDFDPAQALFIGHADGADFLAALIRLHPGLLGQVALLRPQEVLAEGADDLHPVTARVLILKGKQDLLIGNRADRLATALAGPDTRLALVNATHEPSPRDAPALRDWLGLQPPPG